MITKRMLEGREHFVVPTVMMVEGVWSGSKGPIYYPKNALKESATRWNGKPVVVYHPSLYSNGFASHPEVFNRQKIGTIFNTTFDGLRLKCESWIDVERVAQVDDRVLNTILSGQVMEVSTGLITHCDNKYGTFQNRSYNVTANYLIPDHLAVLPDQIGACSIADGAGLIRNYFVRQQPLVRPTLMEAV